MSRPVHPTTLGNFDGQAKALNTVLATRFCGTCVSDTGLKKQYRLRNLVQHRELERMHVRNLTPVPPLPRAFPDRAEEPACQSCFRLASHAQICCLARGCEAKPSSVPYSINARQLQNDCCGKSCAAMSSSQSKPRASENWRFGFEKNDAAALF